MKNRVLKYICYVLFGILLFLFLVYLRFPYEKIKERIISSFEDNSSYALAIGDLRPLFPPGLNFKDIMITQDQTNVDIPVFQASLVSTKVRILPMLLGYQSFVYTIDAYDGQIKGKAEIQDETTGRETSIVGDIHDVNIARYPYIREKYGLTILGKIKGELNVDGNFASSNFKGSIVLKTEGGKIEGIQIKGMPIREISFNGFDSAFKVEGDKLSLTRLSLLGEDIDLLVTGEVLLRKTIGESPIDLKIRIKPKRRFERKYRLLFRLVRSMKDKNGYISFPVKGTFTDPEVTVFQTPAKTKTSRPGRFRPIQRK